MIRGFFSIFNEFVDIFERSVDIISGDLAHVNWGWCLEGRYSLTSQQTKMRNEFAALQWLVRNSPLPACLGLQNKYVFIIFMVFMFMNTHHSNHPAQQTAWWEQAGWWFWRDYPMRLGGRCHSLCLVNYRTAVTCLQLGSRNSPPGGISTGRRMMFLAILTNVLRHLLASGRDLMERIRMFAMEVRVNIPWTPHSQIEKTMGRPVAASASRIVV